LRAAKESLKKLSECDDSYLSILFESKENINLCILELLSIEKNECNLNEKLENQKKNLLDTLSLKMDDLFDEFYDRYCKRTITVDEFRNSIILKDALKDTDDKKLADMYDSVCLDIAKIIFATITKCDIVKFMKNVKADPEVLESVISKFIDKSIESEFSAAIDIERDLLNKDKAENEKIIIKHF
jgi:hypothetical protein